MSDTLYITHDSTGVQVYDVWENAAGQVWNGSSMESYSIAHFEAGDYSVESTESPADSYRFPLIAPAALPAGVYRVSRYEGDPDAPDLGDYWGEMSVVWNGVNLIDNSSAQSTLTKVETMLVLDDDVYQFTAKAVELAPTGGGGGSGEGAYTGTLTVNDGATGLQGVVVNATRGGVLIASGKTDADGKITDWVFDAQTYTLAARLPGYEPAVSSVTVHGNGWTKTISLTAISFTPPSGPGLCTVQFRVMLSGSAVQGAVCKARLQGLNQAADGTILSNDELSDTTDAAGVAELELVQAAEIIKGSGLYKIWVEISGNPVASVTAKIPSQSTILFEDLLP